MKKEVAIGYLFILFIASVSLASAHLPRYVLDDMAILNGSLEIHNPEISQAFYSELNGKPDFYRIESDSPFELYMQVLSPYPDGSRDFSVVVYKNKTLYAALYDPEPLWKIFHEEFAGDNYWQGPEINRNLSAGRYTIIVYNSNNSGKYSLVVGNKESFPLGEVLGLVLVISQIKCGFFDKSIFAVFEGKLGAYLAIVLFGLAIIITLVIFLARKFRKKSRLKRKR